MGSNCSIKRMGGRKGLRLEDVVFAGRREDGTWWGWRSNGAKEGRFEFGTRAGRVG